VDRFETLSPPERAAMIRGLVADAIGTQWHERAGFEAELARRRCDPAPAVRKALVNCRKAGGDYGRS
jgi:hypothetical protein